MGTPADATMSTPAYFQEYENLAFSRDEDGVLVLRFHTDGAPIVFTGQTHQDLPGALEAISLDRDNRALVITGTGDAFMEHSAGRLVRESMPYFFCTLARAGAFARHPERFVS